MIAMNEFYEEMRFGSSRWSDKNDIERAGLFHPKGVCVGFVFGKPIFADGDSPGSFFGGAGVGKLTTLAAYILCGMRIDKRSWYAPLRIFVNDPRGELAAISIQNQVRFNKAAYCINPFGLHGLPQHRVNPWDLLRADSKTFHADARLLVSDLIPLSGSSNAEYFEIRARQWCEALTKYFVLTHGTITLPDLYQLVNNIEDPRAWPSICEAMLGFDDPEIKRTAIEIAGKRADAPKEYSAIMGEIFKSLGFLSDPVIRETLSGSDFSLEVLCGEDCNVYNMIPAEYVEILAPMNRAIVGAAMLYKQRHPSAPRVLFVIDEASSLGRFESLLRGYTYGRGMGIRVLSIWQDTSQIGRNYGANAVSSFLGSSQLRQFLGVRDLDTAKMVSAMLGSQTLEYDVEIEQLAAQRNKNLILRDMLAGGDPYEAGLNYAYQERAAINRLKQGRNLLNPDEILNLPEDQQILFISGRNLMPILANKYSYFTRPEMAGGYMPNPYHPPKDSVRVATRFGMRTRKVITEPVPKKFAHLPQYASGTWSFIEGYRYE